MLQPQHFRHGFNRVAAVGLCPLDCVLPGLSRPRNAHSDGLVEFQTQIEYFSRGIVAHDLVMIRIAFDDRAKAGHGVDFAASKQLP